MHILIGFGIIVGLVAFAFGGNAARNLVRAVIALAGAGIFAIVVFLAITALNELQPAHVTKHPRPTELTGPPGDEPRCGYACAHDDLPQACREWMDAGTPQTAECKDTLNQIKRASK